VIEPVSNLPYDFAMKLFLRQSCVFFLLLLQGIAPFVHAHAHEHRDDMAVNSGLHVHNYLDSHEVISGQAVCKAMDSVISLNPLIKEKQERHDSFIAVYVQLYILQWLPASLQKERFSFVPSIQANTPSITHHNIGPRAPPSVLQS